MRVGFVSLIGRTNAGKSTLLNRVVGTKLAIVSDKPQTTRNRILAVRNYSGDRAAQVIFVDTPGIHRPLHKMNVRMVGIALESIRDVDLIALVRDATDSVGAGDRFVLKSLETAPVPVILGAQQDRPDRQDAAAPAHGLVSPGARVLRHCAGLGLDR